jgi:hypothetical protein
MQLPQKMVEIFVTINDKCSIGLSLRDIHDIINYVAGKILTSLSGSWILIRSHLM